MAVQDDKQYWIFTFGNGQSNEGHYVKIPGTFNEARQEMIRRYGREWAFQYSEAEWSAWVKKCRSEGMGWLLETELDGGA